MVNYANGKIYKLVNNVDAEIYVGSTTNGLARCKAVHKSIARIKSWRVVIHLNEVGWENVRIVLVEEYPCENRDQLRQREQYWIDELQPSLNMSAAYVAPCPHGRQRASCKECVGCSICQNDRQRAQCKRCRGSRICQHNRQRSECKKCLGDKYCCYECNSNFAGKQSLSRHMKSRKHKLEYVRLVWEISEIRMELADVP